MSGQGERKTDWKRIALIYAKHLREIEEWVKLAREEARKHGGE